MRTTARAGGHRPYRGDGRAAGRAAGAHAATPVPLRLVYTAGSGIAVASAAFVSNTILAPADGLSTAVSASRILEVVLVGASLSLGLMVNAHADRPLSRAGSAGLALVLCFAAWALLSAFWSPLPLTGMVKALELGALAVAARCIVRATPGREAERQAIMCNAVALALIGAILVLFCVNLVHWGTPFYFKTSEDLFYQGLDSVPSRVRLQLGYSHPLVGALLLALTTIFVLNSTFPAAVKVCTAAVLCVLLWLCDARGITAALGFSLLLLVVLRARPSLLTAWATGALLVAGVGGAVLVLASADMDTISRHLAGEEVTSLNGRTGLWAYALHLAVQHPLLGVGYFGTRVYLLEAFPFAGHTHNSFLEAFLGTGIIGISLLVIFVGLGLARLIRTRDPLLGACFPLILIEGNLDPVLFVPSFGMFIFMLVFLAADGSPPHSVGLALRRATAGSSRAASGRTEPARTRMIGRS